MNNGTRIFLRNINTATSSGNTLYQESQRLKINSKDDLSMFSPCQYIRLYKLLMSSYTVVLYLYDHGLYKQYKVGFWKAVYKIQPLPNNLHIPRHSISQITSVITKLLSFHSLAFKIQQLLSKVGLKHHWESSHPELHKSPKLRFICQNTGSVCQSSPDNVWLFIYVEQQKWNKNCSGILNDCIMNY